MNEKMSRSKRRDEVISSRFDQHYEPETFCGQKKISHSNSLSIKKQMNPKGCKKRTNFNVKLVHYKFKDHSRTSAVLKANTCTNSAGKCTKRKCTSKGRKHKKPQKASTPLLNLTMEQRRVLRSNDNTLKKKKDVGAPFLYTDCSSNNKLHYNKDACITEAEASTILKHNLQRTSFCKKSKTHINLCNNIVRSGKVLKEHHVITHSENNILPKKTVSRKINMKHSKKQSLNVNKRPQKLWKAQTKATDLQQIISQINIQELSNTNCKIRHNEKFERKGICENQKSAMIKELGKHVLGENKRQRALKAVCHFQKNTRKREDIWQTVNECEQQINKVGKRKYNKKTFREQNPNNFIDITITDNNLVTNENHTNSKQLAISLIKIENLSLAELLKLINDRNYVENRSDIHNKKEICYQANNDIERRESTCNQYRTTELKQNEEINVLYHESIFKRSHSFFKENIIEEMNTNMKNIHVQSSKQKSCLNTEINSTLALINDKHLLRNTDLLGKILKFFLKHKRIARKLRFENSKNEYKCETRRCVAMCVKCIEILNLLEQFSAKVNFMQDEKLCVECTLCNLQIHSLSSFQQHLMDIHLKCEGSSLRKKKKFAVNILNFDQELDLNSNKNLVFECCCCPKTFYHFKLFQTHIKKVHNGFNYTVDNKKPCKAEEGIRTSEICTTYKNGEVCTDHGFNENVIFDIENNMQEISNQENETNVQINKYSNEYCINMTRMNYKNSSMYYNPNSNEVMLKVEVKEQQISNINQLNLREITNATPRIIQVIENWNLIEEYTASSSNISRIAIISEFKESNTISNTQIEEEFRKSISYVCEICSRSYKSKHMLWSHMSKHATNSNIYVNDKEILNEFLNGNDILKLDNNFMLGNSSNCRIYDQGFVHNSILNFPIYLKRRDPNLMLLDIDKEACSSVTENMVCTIGEDAIAIEPHEDCTYVLHINVMYKSKNGIKRQKSLKFDISVAKKRKIDTTVLQISRNTITNMLPVNFKTLTENAENITHNVKVLYCKVCGKGFSSLKILKEHMFFLHDSLLEVPEFLNLPLNLHFTDYHKIEKLSIENIPEFKGKHNVLSEVDVSGAVQEDNDLHKATFNKILNENNAKKRRRKWRCSPCHENFALLRNYLRHKYYCHNDESVVHICDNCNKILTSVAMVNIHVCTNVSSWLCKRCNLDFPNASSLTEHNRSYHFETVGPYTCNQCSLSFLTTYMLQKHMATHSVNSNYSNVNNNLHSASDIVLPNKNEIQVRDVFLEEDLENILELSETDEKPTTTNIAFSTTFSGENLFKCKFCDTVFSTKYDVKLHLYKSHGTITEVCRICNDLYATDELINHLIDMHLVSDISYITENSNTVQLKYEKVTLQENVLKILGLQRLTCLYEYQRFDIIPQNNCFSCVMCSEVFSNIQSYKIHYLEYHDIICLLCNIQFKHNVEAFEHKMKIHVSVDSYLWVVQKLLLATLQLTEYGDCIEEIVLKYSELKLH